jgi:hypothetical protein
MLNVILIESFLLKLILLAQIAAASPDFKKQGFFGRALKNIAYFD